MGYSFLGSRARIGRVCAEIAWAGGMPACAGECAGRAEPAL